MTEYSILFTFESEEGKNYIVYTDEAKDDDGNVMVYASIFHPEKGYPQIEPIETEREWEVIEIILAQLQKKSL